MSEIEYDPALVQWMRENTEPCALTKPELVAVLAAMPTVSTDPDALLKVIPEELSADQGQALVDLVLANRTEDAPDTGTV